MSAQFTKKEIQKLVHWYQENKRDLPWRDTGNPYHVWISEIMLQQTRIEAVISKYLSFIETLPDIQALANVKDDALMRLWEGLGYYSRARNLKKCAQKIMQDYSGSFPSDASSLLRLPGIGPYTAGAICSISFEQPVPAIDGNVLRVISRRFGIQKEIQSKELKKEIQGIIQNTFQETFQPSDINQGFMEIGEVVCIPNGNPHCNECPLRQNCVTKKKKLFDSIPAKKRKIQRKIVNRTLFILRDGDRFLLRKRPENGLLANLYEFIGIDKMLNQKQVLQQVKDFGLEPLRIKKLPNSKHVFSHLEWHMHAYEIQVEQISFVKEPYLIATKKELSNKAIPSAFHTYVEWYSLRDQ